MIAKNLVILSLVAALTGCSGFYTAKKAAAEHAQRAADEALSDAVWIICKASPIGAINRRFKTEVERKARASVCASS
jgi:hypothetical protein